MNLPPPRRQSGPPQRNGPPSRNGASLSKAPSKPKRGLGTSQDELFSGSDVVDWQREWKGMPQFTCEELKAWKQILVSFNSADDIKAFAELLGQKINLTTKSIWFPPALIDKVAHLWWVDSKPHKDGDMYQHYHEWGKEKGGPTNAGLTKKKMREVKIPQSLPADIEAKVLGYQSCLELMVDYEAKFGKEESK